MDIRMAPPPSKVRIVFSMLIFLEAGLLTYYLVAYFLYELYAAAASILVAFVVYYLIQLARRRVADCDLKRLLEDLKRLTGLGGELGLIWMPRGSSTLSGEVRGNHIIIYEKGFEEAAETLIEEFVEYLIGRASQPYVSILNAIIKHVNDEAYRRRDDTAKALTRLLKPLLLKESEQERPTNVNLGVTNCGLGKASGLTC